MYRCPRCGSFIRNGLQYLSEHRKPMGACDQAMDELQEYLEGDGS